MYRLICPNKSHIQGSYRDTYTSLCIRVRTNVAIRTRVGDTVSANYTVLRSLCFPKTGIRARKMYLQHLYPWYGCSFSHALCHILLSLLVTCIRQRYELAHRHSSLFLQVSESCTLPIQVKPVKFGKML